MRLTRSPAWVRSLSSRWFARTRPARRPRPDVKLLIEPLEDRLTPNAYVVNLTGDANTLGFAPNGSAQGSSTGTFSGDLRYCIAQAIADH